MPRTKAPSRPPREGRVQLHINISQEERQRAKIVAAVASQTVSALFRTIFLGEIARRYESIGLADPKKARPPERFVGDDARQKKGTRRRAESGG